MDSNLTKHADFWYKSASPNVPMEMAKLRRSIANFVKILTGFDIPVYFQGERSYTDFERIVIALVNDIDVTVGLALHESCHILLTDLPVLQNFVKNVRAVPFVKVPAGDFRVIRDLLNWIEDRRIDHYCYTHSPGYRAYYDALYNHYFRTEEITELLHDPMIYREPTWESYFFHIINLINPTPNLEALSGLRDVFDALDLDQINRLKDTHDSLILAMRIYAIVKPYIKKTPGKKVNLIKPKFIIDSLVMSQKQENEICERKRVLAVEIMNRQREFIQRKVSSAKVPHDFLKKVQQYDRVHLLKNITAQVAPGGYNQTVFTVIEKITPAELDSGVFPFSLPKSHSWAKQYLIAVQKGFKMGDQILTKLKLITEKQTIIYRRQATGRIDSSILYSAGIGSAEIFRKNFIISTHKPLHLFLLLDYSASMQGEKALKALQLAASLVRVSKKVPQIRLTIACGISEHLVYAFDSQTDSEVMFADVMPRIGFTGGYSFEETHLELMAQKLSASKDRVVYIINVSDGMPTFLNDATKRIKQLMAQMRARGIKMLSYFVYHSADPKQDLYKNQALFREMYGSAASFIEVERFMDIAQTLNRIFLS